MESTEDTRNYGLKKEGLGGLLWTSTIIPRWTD